MTYLDSGRRVTGFDEELGRGLAELHRSTDPRGFGFEADTYCGTTLQPNAWAPDWIAFYRDRRLAYQIELAGETRGFDAAAMRDFDALLERLDEFLDASQPPSLIHGDLWSGNLHVGPDGHPGLIDPAAYFAHREAELGMMRLFGGFSQRVYDAYVEAWPLAAGWRDRLELYELYHVLNHYNLFGGGYGSQAVSIARRWVG
jgi:fructosamine-3-kinase